MRKTNDNSRKLIVHCSCGSLTHVVGIDYIEWDNDSEPKLYIETVCNPYLSWWARIVPAFKYVFLGKPASIDATLISFEDAVKIQEICDLYTDEFISYRERQCDQG